MFWVLRSGEMSVVAEARIFDLGYLKLESCCCRPETQLSRVFDLGFVVSGWEERCVTVTQTPLTFREAFMIRFEQDGEVCFKTPYDSALWEWLSARTGHGACRRLTGSLSDTSLLLGEIHKIIQAAQTRKGRPLKVFLDMTSCPKHVFLDILAFSLADALCSHVCLTYGEGEYHSNRSKLVFASGDWDSAIVPGYRGMPDPERRRFFLVSLGFEGERSLRMVSRYEPDRVSLLVPFPGFCSDYSRRAVENASLLVDEYRIPDDQVRRAPAADVAAALETLQDPGIYRKGTEEITFLCLGTKPHALAMGLHATQNPETILLYNRPARYELVEATFSGRWWVYTIIDPTAL